MWNAGREQYDNTIATKRVSNSIGYFMPKTAGFYGQVMFAPSEVATDNPGTNQYKGDGQVVSTRFGYDDKGAFTAGMAYGITKYSYYVPKNKGGDQTSYSLGATYDFKVVKLWGLYSNDRVGASVAHQALSGNGWSLGVSAPLGAGVLKGSYSSYKWDAGYTPKGTAYFVGTPGANKFSLGYFYSMSKRTWLYGVVAKLDRKDGLDVPLNGSVFNSALDGSSSGFDLGIRHSF
jgi:predicted porin